MVSPRNRMFNSDQFLLGTFASNCSGGMTVTKLPERWKSSWDNNLKLAKLLDAAGIDFMLPIARWIGYGGETNFHGSVLETITWAAGLLAHTNDITVFATTHTAANHPVVVAKQLATIDQISGGRIGLNIVAGWNKPEYEALGLKLPDDHETRYGYAQEWFDIVKALWSREEAFDWDGKYFQLKNVLGDPRPSSPLPIINAAGSGQGREFAVTQRQFPVHAGDRPVALRRGDCGAEGAGESRRPRHRRADLQPRRLPPDREGSEGLSPAFWPGPMPTGRRWTIWCGCNSRTRSPSRTISWR